MTPSFPLARLGCDVQRWGQSSWWVTLWVTLWVRGHDRATRKLSFLIPWGRQYTIRTGLRRTLVPNFFPKMLTGKKSLETQLMNVEMGVWEDVCMHVYVYAYVHVCACLRVHAHTFACSSRTTKKRTQDVLMILGKSFSFLSVSFLI